MSYSKPEVDDELRNKLDAMKPQAAATELVKALAEPARQVAALDYLDDLARETSPNCDDEPPIVTALKDVAVPVLLDLIDREGADHRLLSHALGVIGGPNNERVFKKLVVLVGDNDRDVRLAAPLGLAYFGDRAVPHLEKLLARDGETGKELKAAGGLPHCVHVVCGCLKDIQTKRSIGVLGRAAKSGKYGRFPKDMHLLTLRAFDKAALKVKAAKQASKLPKPPTAAKVKRK